MIDDGPTTNELTEIEDNPVKIQFNDKLFYFEAGMVIVSRMIINMENANGMVVLYKPAQLVPDEMGNVIMIKWMPETDDDYIFIDPHRIMSVCNPQKMILQAYHSSIGASLSGYLPENTTLH